jgi:hypothetical protein
VIFAALRLLVIKTIRPFCPIHFLLLAFTTWVALSLFWTVDMESAITRLGTYGLLLLFFALIWELASTVARVRGLIISYVLGAAFASAGTIQLRDGQVNLTANGARMGDLSLFSRQRQRRRTWIDRCVKHSDGALSSDRKQRGRGTCSVCFTCWFW